VDRWSGIWNGKWQPKWSWVRDSVDQLSMFWTLGIENASQVWIWTSNFEFSRDETKTARMKPKKCALFTKSKTNILFTILFLERQKVQQWILPRIFFCHIDLDEFRHIIVMCGTKQCTKTSLSFTIDIRGRPVYGTDVFLYPFFLLYFLWCDLKSIKRIKSHLSHDNHRWNLHVINLFECCTDEKERRNRKKVSTFTPHY